MTAQAGTLAVVCTGRGQHKRTRLATVIWHEDGNWHMPQPIDGPLSWMPPLEGANSQYIFRCSRCGKDTQIAAAAWRERLNGKWHPRHTGDEVAEFDVSLLPF